MSVFQRIISRFAPGYMRGPWSSTLLEAVGAHMDEQAQRAFEGQCASIPYAGGATTHDGIPLQCGADVLPWHARDRGITLYPTEPEASRRWRLSRFRQLKRHKGSALGVLLNAQPFFRPGALPTIEIVGQSGDGLSATWHSMSPAGVYSVYRKSPSNFDYDGDAFKWSRWAAFIRMHETNFTRPNVYGDGHKYGDGAKYGRGGSNPFTLAMRRDVVSMILGWGAPHAHCVSIALVWQAGDVDKTSAPTQDAAGWWSLPNGAETWRNVVNIGTGLGTRPPMVQWIYDNPA